MRKLVAVSILLLTLSKPITGQHGDSHTATKATPAPAPAAARKSEDKPTVAPPKPAAAPTGSPNTGLKATVDRINKAIAAAHPPEPASGAPSRSAAAPRPSVTASPRVTLDWRVSVVWPAELVGDALK